MRKRRLAAYPKAFREMALERLKQCENISELARELGVHRRLLYKWRDDLEEARSRNESPPENSCEVRLRKEVSRLKSVLADKTVEAHFFRAALQKVEARRQRGANSGEKASTTKSGK